jgi:hypothetical protein
MKHIPWTKFDPTDYREAPNYIKNPIPCPLCKGHTACIVDEDAYGKGQHFKYACSQCGSMFPPGWVEKDSVNATCIHEYSEMNIGNCLHRLTCVKCGITREVDSSG